jgi:hypothetical protein
MSIKKWNKFFEKIGVEDETTEEKTYDDLRDGVNRLMKMQLKKTDFTSRKELALAYLRDEEKNPIEGFINDSDIYEFYLQYRDDIDDLLSDMRWFDETPSENNIFSIYDFIIVSTKKAFREIIGVMVK